jgi:hypothetical protein
MRRVQKLNSNLEKEEFLLNRLQKKKNLFPLLIIMILRASNKIKYGEESQQRDNERGALAKIRVELFS